MTFYQNARRWVFERGHVKFEVRLAVALFEILIKYIVFSRFAVGLICSNNNNCKLQFHQIHVTGCKSYAALNGSLANA